MRKREAEDELESSPLKKAKSQITLGGPSIAPPLTLSESYKERRPTALSTEDADVTKPKSPAPIKTVLLASNTDPFFDSTLIQRPPVATSSSTFVLPGYNPVKSSPQHINQPQAPKSNVIERSETPPPSIKALSSDMSWMPSSAPTMRLGSNDEMSIILPMPTQLPVLGTLSSSSMSIINEKMNVGGEQFVNGTPDEISAELWSLFSMCDVDKDGFIDTDELSIIIYQLTKRLPTQEELKAILDQCDKNRDGVLSFDEFSGVLSRWLIKRRDTSKHPADLLSNSASRASDLAGFLREFTKTTNFDELVNILSTNIEQDYDYENVLGVKCNESDVALGLTDIKIKIEKLAECVANAKVLTSLIIPSIQSTDSAVVISGLEKLRNILSVLEIFVSPLQRATIAIDLLNIFDAVFVSDVIKLVIPLLEDDFSETIAVPDLVIRSKMQYLVLETLSNYAEGPHYRGMNKDSFWNPMLKQSKNQIVNSHGSITILKIINLALRSKCEEVKISAFKCLCNMAAYHSEVRDLICCYFIQYQRTLGVGQAVFKSVIEPIIFRIIQSSNIQDIPELTVATRLCAILCGYTHKKIMNHKDWQDMGGAELLTSFFSIIPITTQPLPDGFGNIVSNILLSIKFLLHGIGPNIEVASRVMEVLALQWTSLHDLSVVAHSVACTLETLISTDNNITRALLDDNKLVPFIENLLSQVKIESLGKIAFVIVNKIIDQKMALLLVRKGPNLISLMIKYISFQQSTLHSIASNTLLNMVTQSNTSRPEIVSFIIREENNSGVTVLCKALTYDADASVVFDFIKARDILSLLVSIFDVINNNSEKDNPVWKIFKLDSMTYLKTFILLIGDGKQNTYIQAWSSNQMSAGIMNNTHYLLSGVGKTFEKLASTQSVAREICKIAMDSLQYLEKLKSIAASKTDSFTLVNTINFQGSLRHLPIRLLVKDDTKKEIKLVSKIPQKIEDLVKEIVRIYGSNIKNLRSPSKTGDKVIVDSQVLYEKMVEHYFENKQEYIVMEVELATALTAGKVYGRKETLIKLRNMGFNVTLPLFHDLRKFMYNNNYHKRDMNKNEFCDLFKKIAPEISSPFILDSLFKEIDSNSSNSVSVYEVLIGLAIMQNGRMEDRLQLAFLSFDENDSGSIDVNELSKLISASSGVDMFKSRELAVRMIFEFDKNKDGSLSFDEFRWAISGVPELLSVFWDAN